MDPFPEFGGIHHFWRWVGETALFLLDSQIEMPTFVFPEFCQLEGAQDFRPAKAGTVPLEWGLRDAEDGLEFCPSLVHKAALVAMDRSQLCYQGRQLW